eukprot:3384783-Amphidinium_carterae.4
MKKKLERDVDALVDKCVLNTSFLKTENEDDVPVRVHKCSTLVPGQIDPPCKPEFGAEDKRTSSRSEEPITVKLDCQVLVPRSWSLGRILRAVRASIQPDKCVFETAQNGVTARLGINAMEGLPVVNYGAARGFRVQRDTVAKNAFHFLSEDLKTIADAQAQSHLVLFQSVLLKDRKCALATFQAKCGVQRFKAMAAALARMGLDDKAD